MYYTYFLFLKNKNIYKGISNNLKRRILEHSQGKVTATKNYRPFKLIGYEAYVLKSDAIRREKYLKTTAGRKFLKQQYRDIIKKLEECLRG